MCQILQLIRLKTKFIGLGAECKIWPLPPISFYLWGSCKDPYRKVRHSPCMTVMWSIDCKQHELHLSDSVRHYTSCLQRSFEHTRGISSGSPPPPPATLLFSLLLPTLPLPSSIFASSIFITSPSLQLPSRCRD